MNKGILVAALGCLLALPMTVCGQKYHYDKGCFERDSLNWCQYSPRESEQPTAYFQQVEEQEDHYIISDGTTKVAVPKTADKCFLIADPETGDWKYLSRVVDPNAPKPQPRKPRLNPELKQHVVRNFRPSTPYDGIHLYNSPFGYLTTIHLPIDDVKKILDSSDYYAYEVQDDATLLVERLGNVGYEEFAAPVNTKITGQFEASRVKKCTYVFTVNDRRAAEAAKASLVKHMGIASKARVGKKYKVAWLKDVALFDMNTEANDDGTYRFIVEVEYQ